MVIKTYSEFRKNMKSILDELTETEDIGVITRKNDNFYVIPEKEYNTIKEMMHLLSTKANRDYLLRSMQEIESGEVVIFESINDL